MHYDLWPLVDTGPVSSGGTPSGQPVFHSGGRTFLRTRGKTKYNGRSSCDENDPSFNSRQVPRDTVRGSRISTSASAVECRCLHRARIWGSTAPCHISISRRASSCTLIAVTC